MATGSEDGDPGEQPDERPLRPDERAGLTNLVGSAGGIKAVEDSPVEAGSHGDEDAPLTPEFRAPPPG
jgi:hypothetical protein